MLLKKHYPMINLDPLKRLLILMLCPLLAIHFAVAESITGVVFQPNPKSKEHWIPKQAEIDKLEKSFAPFLDQQLSNYASTRRIYRQPKQWEYIRQYIGIFVDQKKFIEIRGMCENKNLTKLKTEMFFIFDGGWCYFVATYDPQLDKIVNFDFHGEA